MGTWDIRSMNQGKLEVVKQISNCLASLPLWPPPDNLSLQKQVKHVGKLYVKRTLYGKEAWARKKPMNITRFYYICCTFLQNRRKDWNQCLERAEIV